MTRIVGIAKAALLAWGGASLAAAIVAAAVYAAREPAAQTPDIASGNVANAAPASRAKAEPPGRAKAEPTRRAEVAAPRMARLPRSRPDEPLITGSIRPAIEPSAEAAGALRNEPRGGLLELKRVHDMRRRTASLGGEAGEQSRLPPVVLAAELPAPLPLRAAYLNDVEALRACEDGVRTGLALPSALNRLFASTGVYRAPGDDAVVTFDFETLNGFGLPLLMQAQCVFHGHSLARLEVAPR